MDAIILDMPNGLVKWGLNKSKFPKKGWYYEKYI